MSQETKPVFLLADSQLLFWKENGKYFLERLRPHLPEAGVTAAYIGASNNDDPVFFGLFKSAMQLIGVEDCYQIHSRYLPEEQEILRRADLILLAGGDLEKGWQIIRDTGMQEHLTERYYQGALLLGVSAGAVQLGMVGWRQEKNELALFDTLRIVPLIIDVHHEKEDWTELKAVLQRVNFHHLGAIGIPSGAGLIYHPDHSLEAIRSPLYEFTRQEQQIRENLLLPEK